MQAGESVGQRRVQVLMHGERRLEAFPGDDIGGVDSLLLEQLSRGIPRCQCVRRGAEACQGTVFGGALTSGVSR